MPAAPDIISFFLHSEARRCQTGEEATSALRAAGRSITPRRCSATARVSTNAASSAVSPTGNADLASQWHKRKRRKCSNRVREQNGFVSPDLLEPSELHPFRRYLIQVNQQFKGSTYSIAKPSFAAFYAQTQRGSRESSEKGGIISSSGCSFSLRPCLITVMREWGQAVLMLVFGCRQFQLIRKLQLFIKPALWQLQEPLRMSTSAINALKMPWRKAQA